MYEYKLFTNASEIKELCRVALLNEVHTHGQMMYVYKLGTGIDAACGAYHKGKLIGVCLNVPKHSYNVQICVRPEFQNKGIGRELVQRILPTLKVELSYYSDYHNAGFWSKALKEKENAKERNVSAGRSS